MTIPDEQPDEPPPGARDPHAFRRQFLSHMCIVLTLVYLALLPIVHGRWFPLRGLVIDAILPTRSSSPSPRSTLSPRFASLTPAKSWVGTVTSRVTVTVRACSSSSFSPRMSKSISGHVSATASVTSSSVVTLKRTASVSASTTPSSSSSSQLTKCASASARASISSRVSRMVSKTSCGTATAASSASISSSSTSRRTSSSTPPPSLCAHL